MSPVSSSRVRQGSVGRAAVTVRPSGHRFKVKGCESLLEAGLRAGLNLDYGCGDGRCGLCKARVVGGTVVPLRAAADAPLSAIEREQGYALLCTHTASTEELTILALEAAGPADLPRQDIEAVVRALAPVAPDTRGGSAVGGERDRQDRAAFPGRR